MSADIEEAISEVRAELEQAMALYPAMNSPAEAYAVMLEEVDEVWQIVKTKPSRRILSDLRGEAVQVAAMAIRMMLDVCSEERGRR